MKKHARNVQFWLVGALLHAPFSSRTRPWELRSIDAIDLFDVFCSAVRYETRKNGLLRAITANFNNSEKVIAFDLGRLSEMSINFGVSSRTFNSFLNGYKNDATDFVWLNDRARYFLDFIDKQRIYSPAVQGHSLVKGFVASLKNTEWIPRVVSWIVAINYFKREVFFSLFLENFSKCNRIKVDYNRYFFIGNYLDSFSILNFKFFSNWLGCSSMFSNLNFSNFLNSDFRSSYLLDKRSFFSSDCVVLVDLDLRLENPTFNLRLKNHLYGPRIGKNLVKIFSFGNLVNPLYRVKILGISVKSFIQFLNGCHTFCNTFVKLFKMPFFLLGYGLFEISGLYERLKFGLSQIFNLDFVKNLNYVYFSRHISSLAAYEFGFQPSLCSASVLQQESMTYSSKKSPLNFSFFYGYNAEFNYLLPSFFENTFFSNFFVVYQGTYFTDLAINANVILPADFVLDRNSKFLGIDGRLINIYNNFKYNIHYINDYDFFNFFLSYCRKDFLVSALKKDFLIFFPFKLQKAISSLWGLSLNPLSSNPIGIFVNLMKFNISNNILGGAIFDFFLGEPVCRNSRSMSLASKSNFKILQKRKYKYDF